MGNITTTTPPPSKPTYKPPTTVPSTTPRGIYLPPVDENDAKSSDNRQGKKLVDFVKEFNARVSKKLNEHPVAQISSDDIGDVEDDRQVDEVDKVDENERPGAAADDDDEYGGEIDESFVDALSENYYYDYDNQEIKAKNASSRKLDNVDDDFGNDDDNDGEVEDSSENTTTLPETGTKRNKNRNRNKKRNRKAEERSDEVEENRPDHSLVFEKTIPPKVKKIIDSSVRSDRKANIKVATAKGERANRSVVLAQRS